jgi:MFS family permease
VLALLGVRVLESRPRAGGPALREFLAGFRHLRREPVLARIALAGALAFGVIGLYETVSFAVIDQGLHRPAAFFAVLTSVQGIGALAGGLLSGRLGRALGEARLVGLSLMAFAAGSAAMIMPALPAVLAGILADGMALPWFVVGMATAVQRRTPARLIGRVSAAGDLLVLTPQTVSIAAGAVLVPVVDYRVLLAAIVLVTAGAGAMLLRRQPESHPAARTACEP